MILAGGSITISGSIDADGAAGAQEATESAGGGAGGIIILASRPRSAVLACCPPPGVTVQTIRLALMQAAGGAGVLSICSLRATLWGVPMWPPALQAPALGILTEKVWVEVRWEAMAVTARVSDRASHPRARLAWSSPPRLPTPQLYLSANPVSLSLF